MEIGIITIIFNGYGRFIPKLCESLVKIKPKQFTIVAFGDHGLNEEECRKILGDIELKVIYTEELNHGQARNIAIENTNTDWIIPIDADDELLPEITEEIEKCESDVLSIAYIMRDKDGERICNPAIPTRERIFHPDFYCKMSENFLIPFSPFKRGVWEKIKYPEVEFPNAPFWIELAINNVKFAKTSVPCAVYNTREDSHSNTRTQEEKNKLADDIRNYKKDQRVLKLSIFTICKNEEEMIEDMFKSAQGADEHIVVDTGSTDKTPEIVKKYTDKIYTYKWNDDFSEVKNYAMSKCTGDWVMGLDSDCRLEPDGIEKIREMIKNANSECLNVKLFANQLGGNYWHILGKVFKNGRVKYSGKVHEFPLVDGKSVAGEGDGDVSIVYLYSSSHKKDPDRNLRILLKAVEDEPKSARWKFYLGREYFERKDYVKAIWWMGEFLKIGKWGPERAEANLVIAKSYWQLQMGDMARSTCLKAIEINPEFKEALRCMARYHFEPWKSTWLKYEKVANNKDVLFIR